MLRSRFREMLRDNVTEEFYMVLNKGGKGAQPTAQAYVQPTAPVAEAGVELVGAEEGDADEYDDEGKLKKKTGKSSLKIPLQNAAGTGLKV